MIGSRPAACALPTAAEQRLRVADSSLGHLSASASVYRRNVSVSPVLGGVSAQDGSAGETVDFRRTLASHGVASMRLGHVDEQAWDAQGDATDRAWRADDSRP